ncbi:MAG: hypothetical protein KME47_09370 [Nodosilinea sp. WJT8-NPBG4]|jgi:hypothetical protein|nr:hypothetical protein [Nodosilinea sp. WJT8-NPBG4]
MDANVLSRTSSTGLTAILNSLKSLGGGKGDAIQPQALLPFPDEVSKVRTLSERTAKILVKLYKADKLPDIVVANILELDDIKSLL